MGTDVRHFWVIREKNRLPTERRFLTFGKTTLQNPPVFLPTFLGGFQTASEKLLENDVSA